MRPGVLCSLALLASACGARDDLPLRLGAAAAGEDAGTDAGADGGVPTTTMLLGLGSYHTCVARSDSSIRCFGDNEQGQLGDGTFNGSLQPLTVPLPAASVIDLAVGFRHTCAALYPDAVYCWGENHDGQVAPAEAGLRVPEPYPVALPTGGQDAIVDLAAIPVEGLHDHSTPSGPTRRSHPAAGERPDRPSSGEKDDRACLNLPGALNSLL